jgi:hypothetical protein
LRVYARFTASPTIRLGAAEQGVDDASIDDRKNEARARPTEGNRRSPRLEAKFSSVVVGVVANIFPIQAL